MCECMSKLVYVSVCVGMRDSMCVNMCACVYVCVALASSSRDRACVYSCEWFILSPPGSPRAGHQVA